MEIVVAALGHRPEQPEAAVGDSGPDVGKSTQQCLDVFQRVDPSHPNDRRHGWFRLSDRELSRVDAVVHRADARRGRAVGDLPKAVVTAYRGDEVGLLVGHLGEQFEKAQDDGAGRLGSRSRVYRKGTVPVGRPRVQLAKTGCHGSHFAANAGKVPRPLAVEWHKSVRGGGADERAQKMLEQHEHIHRVGHTEAPLDLAAPAFTAYRCKPEEHFDRPFGVHRCAQLAGEGVPGQHLQGFRERRHCCSRRPGSGRTPPG